MHITSREPFPDFVKNRIQFRYHIFRTLYFLEQGSVKGVKKEVESRKGEDGCKDHGRRRDKVQDRKSVV